MSNGNEDREVILANFQAITGIDDIAIALSTLEQFNWDINNAIVATVSEDPTPSPQVSSCEVNTTFKVDWKGREYSFSLNVNDATVGTLKENLSSRVGVPKENFTIIGFPTMTVQTDHKTLQQMGVSQDCRLMMVETPNQVPNTRGQGSSSSSIMSSSRYRFKMSVEGLEYDLVFPANNHVRQVKSYVESTYNIPASQQRWEGWPPGTSDSLELRDLVLETPFHRLKVFRRQEAGRASVGSDDEFMDEDVLESPECSSTSAQRPLMTVGKSAEENVLQFLQVFEERYGNVHPAFHIGTLKSALTAAFNVPADLKRPLIVFLHSDKALTGHLFCSQVICSESMAGYIDQHFVMWAYDLTERRLQQQILTECQSIFGYSGRQQVEMYVPDKLPLMIVITKVQSAPQVFAVFQGDISPDLLMAQLIDAVENYNQTRSIEKAAELEQEQRSRLRELQEQEYLDSLQRDREKDEMKKIEEKEKQLQVETEEATLSSFEDLVPPEPDSNTPSSDITFKLPSGERINRKFVHRTQLKVLSYFVGSKGYPPAKFKLVQNFPKRQFDEDEMYLTLDDLGLTRREILYVEERD